MLSKGDDYPLHQTPEPVAFSGTDRNFYDRYFFNGYDPELNLFFAAALGVYPHLEITDASFCLMIDGQQHNVRASRHLNGERLDMQVGPIAIRIIEPLQQLSVSLAANDSGITADLIFTGRHAPIEEPRFIRRNGARAFMDYTRMTQNGGWSGTISMHGKTIDVGALQCLGTRDRSWGVRPVGTTDSQPPVGGSLAQFYWLWCPFNFDDAATFYHSNDDGNGLPWNRRGVVAALDAPAHDLDGPAWTCTYHPGTRRIASASLDLGEERGRIVYQPTGAHFYMMGLGYTHPEWGHGMDHGPLAVACDAIDLASMNDNDPRFLHIQALAFAEWHRDGKVSRGVGVIEQMLIGPHAPSGFAGLLDGAPA